MRRDRILRGVIHERFVVTDVDGHAYQGLLADADDRVTHFVDASTLGPSGQLVPIDGDFYLERSRIAYMQKLGG